MTDIFSREKRSEIMRRIRGRETKVELAFKPFLERLGFEYQPRDVRADFAHRDKRITVFVDGCFWHGCLDHYREPKSHKDYWIPKIETNKKRDAEYTRRLVGDGWRVVRIWEHTIKRNLRGAVAVVELLMSDLVSGDKWKACRL